MITRRFETVLELIEFAFEKFPDLTAFTYMGCDYSYAEIDRLSQRFASYLQNHTDLQPGDRIAIQLPNIVQYPIVVYGAIRAGLIIVNTNPLYTGRELCHQLKDSGASALVVLSNVAECAAEVVKDTNLKTVIVTDLGDSLPPVKKLLVNFVVRHIKKLVPKFHIDGAIAFSQAMNQGDKPFRRHEPKPEDILALQYTGGTTGVAKGAMLTHANLCSNVHQVLNHMDKLFKEPSEVFATALPLYHIFAFTMHLMCAVTGGGHNVLIPNPRDLKAFIKAIQKYQVSVFIAVNTLYNALARFPDFQKLDFSNLKTSAAGGMSVTEDVIDAWYKLTGCKICEGYGLTETSPVLISNPDNQIITGTMGTPLINTEIRLVDSEGKDVADGEPGEVWARGPQVMKGYWEKPDATAEVLTEDGWFKTGDIAMRRSDGYYKMVDRLKDMIVVSGFNVYPSEVEEVICQHPDIVEAAVIGVPAKHAGETVKLFVVSSNPDLSKEEIIEYCKKNLTAYKVPKIIEFRETLPKSNVGKILRKDLRE